MATGLAATRVWTDAAAAPPFAAALLVREGVVEVAAGPEFLTVRSDRAERWGDPAFVAGLLEAILEAQRRRLDFTEGLHREEGVDHHPSDAEVVARIEAVIAERLRPYVEGDGGEIALVAFRDGVARVALRGACSGCPSSSGTLRVGVERLLRHYVPEVLRVEAA